MRIPGSCDRSVRWFAVFVALGLYLTLRGYHSRDGDQAYRLPILLNQQSPSVFANDPFVQAFDQFNPHRGYLALLDAASRPAGLSVALAVLFAATFAINVVGVDRLARLCWPDEKWQGGVWAVTMLLIAKAGNIGTNHLFEAMLLDRLIAIGLGWIALGYLVNDRPRVGAAAGVLGVATLIHPSMGLQLGMLVSTSLIMWACVEAPGWERLRESLVGIVWIVLGLLPGVGLMMSQRVRLTDGLPIEDFYALSALIQSPQHMVPHLWRAEQWLAWGCYPVLAAVALVEGRRYASIARNRITMATGIAMVGLFVAWVCIEVLHSVSITVFQPFRTATVARGLCLVLASEHVGKLWRSDRIWDRCRAALIVFGLAGDLALIVATMVELGSISTRRLGRTAEMVTCPTLLAAGLYYLSRHDTESGQISLGLGLGLAILYTGWVRWGIPVAWNPRRVVWMIMLAWFVPVLALLPAGVLPEALEARLSEHCRFGEVPVDEVEHLAVWSRDHTPRNARFVTPPGPKTFRLWSRRDVAFNRAAGPYHAKGLAEWAARFQDHVGFRGNLPEFAREYLKNRQALEQGFDAMNDREKAELARRHGADFLLAAAPKASEKTTSDVLELLHVEGRYAVYRVKTDRTQEARVATTEAVKPGLSLDAR